MTQPAGAAVISDDLVTAFECCGKVFPTAISRRSHQAHHNRPLIDDQERFWSRVDKAGLSPSRRPDLGSCWVWIGAVSRNRYASFSVRGHTVSAHRLAYELLVGPVPKGLQLDHLCRNRICVNPGHLEAVTPAENTRRGDNAQRNKTHCPQGHPYDESNTALWSGHRNCRACNRAKGNAFYHAHLAKKRAA